MPTIEISKKDLIKLVKRKFDLDKASGWIKSEIEVDKEDKDLLHVELKDINRPDLWSTEGIAREIKTRLGIMPAYVIGSGQYLVKVNPKVKVARPLIAAAVIKDLRLDEKAIEQLVQLQEKLCESFGLKRKEAALGIYDFDKIFWPVIYTTYKPDSLKFRALGFDKEMTLKEILSKHEKGKQYGYLIEKKKEWPILIDASKNVLSMPPIINSEYSGKVTEKTKNVFVEVTGFSDRFVLLVLNIMVAALAERGAKIETVKIKTRFRTKIMPDFTPKEIKIGLAELNSILGLDLKTKEELDLVAESGFSVKGHKGSEVTLLIPPWRQDVMSVRDVAEDIAIGYGYLKFKPLPLELATKSRLNEKNIFTKKIAQFFAGLGAQEIATFGLTNKELLFKKAKIKQQPVVEVSNPVALSHTCLRPWLLPSLLEFLSLNKNARYPQNIFEIATTVSVEAKNKTEEISEQEKLCFVIANSSATFTDIKQILDAFFDWLDLKYKLNAFEHPSFIDGRIGEIMIGNKSVGFIGEIHPKVLDLWNIKMPAVAFELDLDELFRILT